MSKALELARELVKVLEAAEQVASVDGCTDKVKLQDLQLGDKFDTELGSFIVLDHTDEGLTKVIQEWFYKKDVEFGNSIDYKDSELKNLFDGEITEAYEKVFGDALVEHTVQIKSVDSQDYGEITCKVRPLTFDEAREYNPLLVNKDLYGWWWTCNPWSSADRGWKYSIAVVSSGGDFNLIYYNSSCGVRPVCILKSNIFVSKEA